MISEPVEIERHRHDILAACAAAPAAERPVLLAQACVGDERLHAELAGLLQHLEARTPVLPANLGLVVEEQLARRYLGRTIGPYRIERLLARGGFSRVFLASEPMSGSSRFRAWRALKVPCGEVLSDAVARSRLEVAILGRLLHPNIARLIDVVESDEGPVLVLEYLEGVRGIAAACHRAGYSVRRRVEFFLPILSALQFAHEREVIHCDLSGGNVVLPRRFRRPVLIDFGVSEVGWRDGRVTAVGPRPLTYEYASPEQLRGEPLGPSTDIYSAGALLYELLTGVQPHGIDRSNLDASRAAVCDTPVLAPSGRVVSEGSGSWISGGLSAVAPQWLPNYLADLRDADEIVLRALEKRPEKRYESAAAFGSELEALLRGCPPGSVGAWDLEPRQRAS